MTKLMNRNFNPRPPCGGRPSGTTVTAMVAAFQSTSSVWRTTAEDAESSACHSKFQSTSSVWRTTELHRVHLGRGEISIHVLRVEDDPSFVGRVRIWHKFQSTSSVWRTTFGWMIDPQGRRISIHVLRVEDDGERNRQLQRPGISIHVLRVEDDRWRRTVPSTRPKFQSTSSVWRTTSALWAARTGREISIHVLRVEDDCRC